MSLHPESRGEPPGRRHQAEVRLPGQDRGGEDLRCSCPRRGDAEGRSPYRGDNPMGVWWGLRVGADGRGPGYPVVVFGGEHADLPLDEDKASELADALVATNVSAVITSPI